MEKKMCITLSACLSVHPSSLFLSSACILHTSAYLSVEYWTNAELKRLCTVCLAVSSVTAEKSLEVSIACSFCDALV